MHPVLAQLYIESRQHDLEQAARRNAPVPAARRQHRSMIRSAFRASRHA